MLRQTALTLIALIGLTVTGIALGQTTGESNDDYREVASTDLEFAQPSKPIGLSRILRRVEVDVLPGLKASDPEMGLSMADSQPLNLDDIVRQTSIPRPLNLSSGGIIEASEKSDAKLFELRF